MDRYLCIHCHFYQPPRENPWLEAIELQESAYPYHDWNERITAECYAPNAASRILTSGQPHRPDRQQLLADQLQCRPHPAFLDGRPRPETYQAILDADRESQKRFSGHGSAIAQVYNHMIMPLANRRDKQTQVVWGIADFEFRFDREPEGMWLRRDRRGHRDARSAGRERTSSSRCWRRTRPRRERRVGPPSSRTSRAARSIPPVPTCCNLPSGRSINLFFYDGPISRAVAFEGLLSDGERFANRLMGGFADSATLAAVDAHRHRRRNLRPPPPQGEMALAYALHHIESKKLAQLTNYGEYLDHQSADARSRDSREHRLELLPRRGPLEQPTAAATPAASRAGTRTGAPRCARRSIGCATAWSSPMKPRLAEFLHDPWLARDDYIEHGARPRRSQPQQVPRRARPPASCRDDEVVTVLSLLEMQRHAMLMYTSCGWFFDELSGIETVQVIMYAGRALQLAQRLFPDHHEQTFRELSAIGEEQPCPSLATAPRSSTDS